MNRYLPLSIFMGLLIVFAVGLTMNPKNIPSPLVGKTAPVMTSPWLDGVAYVDHSRVQGRWWVLNVWASWCSVCYQEHRAFVDFHAQHPNLPIYGLNYKDTTEDAIAWLNRLGNPYDGVWIDRQGQDGINWGVYGVPETFLIDPNGIVKYRWTGAMDKASLASLQRMMLQE